MEEDAPATEPNRINRKKPGHLKIQGVVNVGLLLRAISNAGCNGVEQAADLCKTHPRNIHLLLNFTGEIPRLDALWRICGGLKINVNELITVPGSAENWKGPGHVSRIDQPRIAELKALLLETKELLRKIESALERLSGAGSL
jgi:hypothetical protein